MAVDESRSGDIVLAPNEICLISDETSGQIKTLVGPYKMSLGQQSEVPVKYDPDTRKFSRTTKEQATQLWPLARDGEYLVLQNPAETGGEEHPKAGTVNTSYRLSYGTSINIPGPASFPLWPGQSVEVIKGHVLKSNQYLVVEVINAELAMKNWDQAVVKKTAESEKENEVPTLVTGERLVIKGTEVSFYIPPTGARVVPMNNSEYVRNAATIESLEYCILLDEDGNKRHVRGPAVVFPEPTEDFFVTDGKRKFRATELNNLMGVHVRVIQDFEEGDTKYKAGEEYFITGADQPIYFPRPELATVSYDGRKVHFAIAIPDGEGRYVLNRTTGEVDLVRGPKMFMPNPIAEVVAKRILSELEVELLYPGNAKALKYNRDLQGQSIAEAESIANAGRARDRTTVKSAVYASAALTEEPGGDIDAGEELKRRNTFTPPRTITMDTKYDGAVTVRIWNNYAIMISNSKGERRAIQGPAVVLLEFDEIAEALSLSTGKPKTTDVLLRTPYLQVRHNVVSDIVEVETEDVVTMRLKMSYKINFVGDDPTKWFAVENYVKYACDRIRSILKSVAKKHKAEDFYKNSVEIVRDAILGVAPEKKGDAKAERPGKLFEENNMQVYDLEVFRTEIMDSQIAEKLVAEQRSVFDATLKIAAQRRNLHVTQETEDVARKIENECDKTAIAKHERILAEIERKTKAQVAEQQSKLAVQLQSLEADKAANDAAAANKRDAALQESETERLVEAAAAETMKLEIANEEAAFAARMDHRSKEFAADEEAAKATLDRELQKVVAESNAVKDRMASVTPQLVAAMQAMGDADLVSALTKHMSPLAILGGTSVAEVVKNMLAGTPLESRVKQLMG